MIKAHHNMKQKQSLQSLVNELAPILTPYFNLPNARPSLVIGEGASRSPFSYDKVSGHIFAKENVFDGIVLEYTLGEEIGHFLHHKAMPTFSEETEQVVNLLRENPSDEHAQSYMFLKNFSEFIGCYSGLTVISKRANARQMAAYMDSFLDGICGHAAPTTEAAATHFLGYVAAWMIFKRHQDKELAGFVHYTGAQAKEFINPANLKNNQLLR